MNTTCEFCHKTFCNKSTLTRHLNICKRKELVFIQRTNEQLEEQQHNHEKQLEEQQQQYEKQLEEQKQQYEKQLEKLESHIQKLENQIFEIAKQPKQIHNNNSKNTTTHNNQRMLNIINQLAPYDLTTERVQEILDSHALENIFKDGPNSIADFVVEKILTDPDTQKPKLIATDRSRGVFKYKDTDGNVHIDNKLTKTTGILQKPLFKANDQVLVEIFQRHDYDIDDVTRETFRDNTELLNCVNKEKLSAQLSRRLESEHVHFED